MNKFGSSCSWKHLQKSLPVPDDEDESEPKKRRPPNANVCTPFWVPAHHMSDEDEVVEVELEEVVEVENKKKKNKKKNKKKGNGE